MSPERDAPRSTFSVDDGLRAAAAGHPGDGQADLAVGHREPLHRPPARPRRGGEIADGGTHRPRPHRDRGRARPGLRPVRRGDARVLRDVVKGSGGPLAGAATSCARASTTSTRRSRPAAGCSRSSPGTSALLERFLVDSATLVNALARRRDDLTGVVGNLNATFGALGASRPPGRVDRAAASVHAPRQHDLREPARRAQRRRPAGGRRQARRAAPRAVPRPGAAVRPDGEPTMRDLSRTIRRPGARTT